MKIFALYSILAVAFAVFTQIDVIHGGGSSINLCDYAHEAFDPIYNETIALLTESFQNANQSLYNVNMAVSHAEYVSMLQFIIDQLMEANYPTFSNAIDVVSSLTGVSSDDINALINERPSDIPEPLSCLFDMLVALFDAYNSYGNSIMSIAQVLSDSQYIVGQARPNTTSSFSSI